MFLLTCAALLDQHDKRCVFDEVAVFDSSSETLFVYDTKNNRVIGKKVGVNMILSGKTKLTKENVRESNDT